MIHFTVSVLTLEINQMALTNTFMINAVYVKSNLLIFHHKHEYIRQAGWRVLAISSCWRHILENLALEINILLFVGTSRETWNSNFNHIFYSHLFTKCKLNFLITWMKDIWIHFLVCAYLARWLFSRMCWELSLECTCRLSALFMHVLDTLLSVHMHLDYSSHEYSGHCPWCAHAGWLL